MFKNAGLFTRPTPARQDVPFLGAAAGSEMRGVIFHPPNPRACQDRLCARLPYADTLSDARTRPGKGRVLARLGERRV